MMTDDENIGYYRALGYYAGVWYRDCNRTIDSSVGESAESENGLYVYCIRYERARLGRESEGRPLSRSRRITSGYSSLYA